MGVKPQTVDVHVRRGNLPEEPDGTIPEDAVEVAVARRKPGPKPAQRLYDWKTAGEKFTAKMKRLAYLEAKGQLVRRSVYEAELAELGTLVRDRLRAIGKRLRDRLAAETSARVCGDLVDRAVDEALEVLAKGAE